MTADPDTMTTRRRKVTALTPCYNSAAFIERTLESILAQSWPEIEVLVGDDASTDDTLAIVRRFAEGRPNVRVIARTENLGWLRNSNDLMAQASGELMFFAFHDDLIAPTYVEKLVKALDASPGAMLAYSDLELFAVDGERSLHAFAKMDGVESALARGVLMAQWPVDWWVPNRGLFRASAFRRIGGIKPNDAGEFAADWTWLLHMALLGPFVRIPELLVQKFYKKNSLSRSWAHDAGQLAAVRRAGLREIAASPLHPAAKAVLSLYLRRKAAGGKRIGFLPGPAKAWLRRVLGLPGPVR